jgi:hypothetical protein
VSVATNATLKELHFGPDSTAHFVQVAGVKPTTRRRREQMGRESQPQKPKPGQGKGPRTKLRDIAIQIQACLNDAEALMNAEPSELAISKTKLCQARLRALTIQQAIERNDRLKEALAEVTRLTERLKVLEGVAEEQQAKPRQPEPTEIDLVLQRYEEERKNRTPSQTSGASDTEPQVLEPAPPSAEELAEQQAKEAEEKALAEKQRVLERKRQEREHQEKMAALDRELAAEDAKLAEFGPAFYIPKTTGGLL